MKKNVASFQIEGLEPNAGPAQIIVQEDTRVYCKICNKLLTIKKGEAIPLCCGRLMEVMD